MFQFSTTCREQGLAGREELDCEGIRKSVIYIWHAVAVKRAGVTVGRIKKN